MSQLKRIKLKKQVLLFLKGVYKKNNVIIIWKGQTIEAAEIKRGFKQRGPPSPLLFMTYLSDPGRELDRSKESFDLS